MVPQHFLSNIRVLAAPTRVAPHLPLAHPCLLASQAGRDACIVVGVRGCIVHCAELWVMQASSV